MAGVPILSPKRSVGEHERNLGNAGFDLTLLFSTLLLLYSPASSLVSFFPVAGILLLLLVLWLSNLPTPLLSHPAKNF